MRPYFTQLFKASNNHPSWHYCQHSVLLARQCQNTLPSQKLTQTITTTQIRFNGGGNILAVIDPRKMSEQTKNKTNKKIQSKHRKQGNASSYKFVDRTRIKVMGGMGGKGCLSYESKLGSKFKKRPDGGHGGNGGCVVIVADGNEQSLNMSTHHYRGDDGVHGSSRQKHGRKGKDKIIKVPCGVLVKRVLGYNEIWDEKEGVVKTINFDENNGDHNDGNDRDHNDDNDHDQYETQQYNEYKFNKNLYQDTPLNLSQSLELESDEDDNENNNDKMTAHSHSHADNSNSNDNNNSNDENQRQTQNENQNLPHDFEDVVNTGTKSEEDGMFHWKQDHDNSSFLGMGYGLDLDDELALASSSTFANLHNMEREKITIADLDKPGSYVVIAQGGRGGVGNSAYAKRQFIPQHIARATEKSKASPGEEVYLELELKLIADIGLVGFPNAGKSSLLAAMSKAQPEIAPYPFTTLHPLIGCVEYRDGFRALVADVPGLIDGAAAGRGRGHDFLKHLERTKALIYIVDAAGVDGRDPLDDLSTLVDEIESYGDGDMMTRPAFVVANKLDLIPDHNMREEIFAALNDVAKEKGIIYHRKAIGISAGVSGEGLGNLSKSIRDLVELGEQYRIKENETWDSYAQT